MSSRKLVRVSSIVAASAVGIELISIVAEQLIAPVLGILMIAVSIVAGIAQLVAIVSRYSYFAIIARRIPNQQLVERSLMIRKGVIVCLIVGVAAGILAAIFDGAGVGIGMIIFIPLGIAMLVFGIMTIFLIYRLQVSVAAESASANINWVAAPQSNASVTTTPPTLPPSVDG